MRRLEGVVWAGIVVAVGAGLEAFGWFLRVVPSPHGNAIGEPYVSNPGVADTAFASDSWV